MNRRRREAVAVFVGSEIRLYPLRELARADGGVADRIDGLSVQLHYEEKERALRVENEDGERVRHFVAFLADLEVFYPEAEVYSFQKESR